MAKKYMSASERRIAQIKKDHPTILKSVKRKPKKRRK